MEGGGGRSGCGVRGEGVGGEVILLLKDNTKFVYPNSNRHYLMSGH